MTSVAVTGATGFVGQHILNRLITSGCSVRAIVRKPAHLNPHPALDIAYTPDLFSENPARLAELVDGVHTLIHAAWYAEPGKYLTSPLNVDCLTGTLNLARAFAAAGGARFIGVGSCAEYDTTPGVLTTETALAPTTLYAACKASASLTLPHILEGVEFAWCRLFYLYGQGEDERRLVPYLRRQLESGQEALLSRGEQIRDFLDVEEAVEQIVDVALSDRQGAVNICSGVGISVRQLAERIADEYGRRDLLRFGAKPDNAFDPPQIIGQP